MSFVQHTTQPHPPNPNPSPKKQLALDYVTQHPLVARADYPYTAALGRAGPTCRADNGLEPCSGIQSYLYVRPCDDRVLMQAVARAPVVVALDAYCDDFMNYKSGVMTFSCAAPEDEGGQEVTDEMCEREVNHAVAIVGYGTDERTGLDFWIFKNSWGTVRDGCACVVLVSGWALVAQPHPLTRRPPTYTPHRAGASAGTAASSGARSARARATTGCTSAGWAASPTTPFCPSAGCVVYLFVHTRMADVHSD